MNGGLPPDRARRGHVFAWDWDRWRLWDAVFAVLAILLLCVTAAVSMGTLWVTMKAAQSQERADRSEHYANATASLTDDTTFGRVAGAYGLFAYAESYEEHRTEVLQVLASRLKDSARAEGDRLTGNELFVTASLLKRVSLLEPAPDDLRQYDIADARLEGAALTGLKAEGSYFRRTDFRDAFLEDVEWVCVDARGARLEGAVLTGSVAGADLTGADLRTANDLVGVTLEAVAHDPTTQWPAGFQPPASTPYRSDDCERERLGR